MDKDKNKIFLKSEKNKKKIQLIRVVILLVLNHHQIKHPHRKINQI